jgi:hypothetical protein
MVGVVVGEGHLPAVLDEERHAVGRKGDEPGGVVEICDDTIGVNMARRCNMAVRVGEVSDLVDDQECRVDIVAQPPSQG